MQVRNADVRSLGESDIFVLSKNDLESAVKAFPLLAKKLFAAIAPRAKANAEASAKRERDAQDTNRRMSVMESMMSRNLKHVISVDHEPL